MKSLIFFFFLFFQEHFPASWLGGWLGGWLDGWLAGWLAGWPARPGHGQSGHGQPGHGHPGHGQQARLRPLSFQDMCHKEYTPWPLSSSFQYIVNKEYIRVYSMATLLELLRHV